MDPANLPYLARDGHHWDQSIEMSNGTANGNELAYTAKWWEVARKARALADEITDPEHKAAMIQVADGLDRLAEQEANDPK